MRIKHEKKKPESKDYTLYYMILFYFHSEV